MLDAMFPDGSHAKGDLWESYLPTKSGHSSYTKDETFPRKRFIQGAGLSTIALMIENVVGLSISLPRKTVDWIIPNLEIMGIENLSLKRNMITILSNKSSRGWEIQMESEKLYYFTINILGQKKKTLPRSNWDIVKNTHEALVDRITFERVQNNVKRVNKTINTNREKRLFENLIYCEECGNQLGVMYRKNHDYWTVNCNRYSRDPRRRMCEPHFMPYDKLEEALLETIKKSCKEYIEQIKNNYKKYAEAVVRALTEYLNLTYTPVEGSNYYTVKSGDSLWSIAKKNNCIIKNNK